MATYAPFRFLYGIINVIFSLVFLALFLRFILKLFGANAATPFVSWMYNITDPLLNPFVGIFPSPILEGGLVLEFTTLFALLVYAIIHQLIMALLSWLDSMATESGSRRRVIA